MWKLHLLYMANIPLGVHFDFKVFLTKPVSANFMTITKMFPDFWKKTVLLFLALLLICGDCYFGVLDISFDLKFLQCLWFADLLETAQFYNASTNNISLNLNRCKILITHWEFFTSHVSIPVWTLNNPCSNSSWPLTSVF